MAVQVPCTECGKPVVKRKRGLCHTCYQRAWSQGRLADYERARWRSVDLCAEWRFLAAQGFTQRQAAERLGVSYDQLHYAIKRAGAAA